MFAMPITTWRRARSFLQMPHCGSPEEESAFLKQHQRWLPHSVVVILAVGAVGHAAHLVLSVRQEQQRVDNPFAWDSQDARFVTFAFWIAAIWLRIFTISCICATHLHHPEMGIKVAEAAGLTCSTLICIGTPVMNPGRGPILFGADPRDVWINSSEISSLVLVFTHIVVTSVLPFRCSALLVNHCIVTMSNALIRFGLPGPFPEEETWIMVMVAIVAGSSFTSTYRIESVTRQNWIAMRTSQSAAEGTQTELERQQATTNAMRTVFRVLFDVVLQTGETFALTVENCNFRGVFGNIGAGARLTDLVTPDDADRIRNLARDASTLNVPQLTTVALTSSTGDHIPHVEVLMVDTNLDAENRYLVGLRVPPLPLDNRADPLPVDYRDEARRQGQEGQGVQGFPTGHLDETRRHTDAPASARVRNDRDLSSISSDAITSRPWMPLEITSDDEAVAIVNTVGSRLTIVSCSASFADVCEPSPLGMDFGSWITDSAPFRNWLEWQINTILNDPHPNANISPCAQITLCPPSAMARGVELRMAVKVFPVNIDVISDVSDDRMPVQLTVQRVRWRAFEDSATKSKRVYL